MILIDVTLLVYAYNASDPHFPKASEWFSLVMSSDETICFCRETLCGFIRISTNIAAVPNPYNLNEAFDIVEEWISAPNVIVLEPTSDHFETLRRVSSKAGAIGRHFSDAVLATYAITNNARFATTDDDFKKFKGLNFFNPLVNLLQFPNV